ncbi:MAG: hypothetical protein GAK40_00962 [Burkholderia plantarii]|nr:MAG: hypothetical protein GAK40_00962 [Burkholderia plantarii]
MIIRWLLAAIHLSAFGLAMTAIATRNRALKRVAASDPASADLPAVFRADIYWAVTALVLLATGALRAFGAFEKGTAYYLHSPWFHLKMTAFVAILALEVRPMIAFMRWRAAHQRGVVPDLSSARTFARIGHAQAALILVIVFSAAAMARAVG